ncbi:hypothetical protein GCM10023213_13910 [Prosthecobacter algae]|uniref:Uncharacterized protein n=1 Tax=Prosthecobacter algae TaxID=1144682 RepID=A0ABP9P1R4_9BACT
MAEQRSYSINVTLKSEAQIAPIKTTEKAIEGVSKAAETASNKLTQTGKDLEDRFAKVKEMLARTREEVEKGKSGGGSDAGAGATGGLKDTLNQGLDKVLSGNILQGAGAAAGAAGAWQFGKMIGDEIMKGLEHWANGGSWSDYWDKTWQRLGEATGIESWSFPGRLKDVMRGAEMALADNQKQWQEWVKEINRAEPRDAINRLEELTISLNKTKLAMSQLMDVENARRQANMAGIDQDEQDAIQQIEMDPVLNQSDKTVAIQKARAEAERRRLAERTQQREDQASISRGGVTAAENDLQKKRQLEAEEMQRARQFAEISGVGKQASFGLSGEAADQAYKNAFETEAKRRGSDLTPDYDSSKQQQAAKDAVKAAEKALEEAKSKDQTTREKLAIEQGSDITNTERKLERDRVRSWSQSEAQRKQEEAANRPSEATQPDAPPMYDRSGEDQIRGALGELGQGTGDASRKAAYDEAAAGLKNNDTSEEEKAKLKQLAENLAASGTEQGTRLAETITQGLAKVAANQQAFDAALKRLEGQFAAFNERTAQ